jgi:crossover junction endonuclease MUS81
MMILISERKGKDDLISSIQDGRFKEQKTRLSKCGISNVVYLVEEFDPFAFIGDSLATALTETQIIHDFFVKCTANVEGSVDYLTRMTKLLQATLNPTDLEIMHPNDIKLETHHLLRRHLAKIGKPALISLSTFSTLNSKSKNLQSKDFFQRQLMAIRGISAEKAFILAKHFTSMADLIQKLDACGAEDQKIKLLQSCSEANIPRRQFGKVLAKHIITSIYG